MTLSSLILVFVTGLMSAAHCIGMCGGIITAVTLQSKLSALKTNLLYHIGRGFSYTLFGIVLGIIGSFIEVAGDWSGIKGVASIVGGCMLLLWVWRKIQIPQLETVSAHVHARLIKVVKYLRGGERVYILMTGIAFGFLPCGLTYAMGMQAASTGTWYAGGLTMLVFSLGTLPALALTASISAIATKQWRRVMFKIGNGAAIIIGILAIMKGLAANHVIPSIHHWLW